MKTFKSSNGGYWTAEPATAPEYMRGREKQGYRFYLLKFYNAAGELIRKELATVLPSVPDCYAEKVKA